MSNTILKFEDFINKQITESSKDTQTEIDSINQTKDLRKKLELAKTPEERVAILTQIKQIEQRIEQQKNNIK